MQPIEALDTLALGDGDRLKLVLRPTRVSWQRHFEVYLERHGRVSGTPSVSGIYSAGNVSLKAPGWMDVNYRSKVRLDDSIIEMSGSSGERELFEALGRAIPEGGSMMIAYRMFVGEEEIHRVTRDALDAGIPPVLTPLGRLMFRADCGWAFKDWYIAEGGREGPEKLQGFKLESEEDRAASAARLAGDLQQFLAKSPKAGSGVADTARNIAQELLPLLNEWARQQRG
jgi:hypothetical protein